MPYSVEPFAERPFVLEVTSTGSWLIRIRTCLSFLFRSAVVPGYRREELLLLKLSIAREDCSRPLSAPSIWPYLRFRSAS